MLLIVKEIPFVILTRAKRVLVENSRFHYKASGFFFLRQCGSPSGVPRTQLLLRYGRTPPRFWNVSSESSFWAKDPVDGSFAVLCNTLDMTIVRWLNG